VQQNFYKSPSRERARYLDPYSLRLALSDHCSIARGRGKCGIRECGPVAYLRLREPQDDSPPFSLSLSLFFSGKTYESRGKREGGRKSRVAPSWLCTGRFVRLWMGFSGASTRRARRSGSNTKTAVLRQPVRVRARARGDGNKYVKLGRGG